MLSTVVVWPQLLSTDGECFVLTLLLEDFWCIKELAEENVGGQR
jgi:hypothetical protein